MLESLESHLKNHHDLHVARAVAMTIARDYSSAAVYSWLAIDKDVKKRLKELGAISINDNDAFIFVIAFHVALHKVREEFYHSSLRDVQYDLAAARTSPFRLGNRSFTCYSMALFHHYADFIAALRLYRGISGAADAVEKAFVDMKDSGETVPESLLSDDYKLLRQISTEILTEQVQQMQYIPDLSSKFFKGISKGINVNGIRRMAMRSFGDICIPNDDGIGDSHDVESEIHWEFARALSLRLQSAERGRVIEESPTRQPNDLEKEVFALITNNALPGGSIAIKVGRSYDYMRQVLARLVKDRLVEKVDNGYLKRV